MDTLSCSLEGRPFINFINMLNKKLFYNDNTINIDVISGLFENLELDISNIQFEITCFEEVRYELCAIYLFTLLYHIIS